MKIARRIILVTFLLFVLVCIAVPSNFFQDTFGMRRKAYVLASDSRARQMCMAVLLYHEDYQSIPSGSNPDIVRAVNGANAKQTVYLRATELETNRAGEYVDAWRKPYRIEISTNEVVVTSAGRNKRFGDEDDIIARESLVAPLKSK